MATAKKILKEGAGFLPGVGTAMDVADVGKSIATGDYVGAAVNTAATVLGIVPIVGRIAGKGVKAASKLFRKTDVEEAKKLIKNPEAKKEWQDINRLPESQRQKRKPEVEQAAQKLDEGQITSREYREISKREQPIKSITEENFPEMPTLKNVVGSLKKDQIETGVVGLNKKIPDGTKVASRLDIPAYDNYDTWIVSIHDGSVKNGRAIGYGQSAILKGVTFESSSKASLNIARGKKSKSTIARIYGDYYNADPEDTYDLARDLLNDPDWTQIGMNPFRHSYFYDKATGNPVTRAAEVVQVGPLVLARGISKPTITELKQLGVKTSSGKLKIFNQGGLTTDEQTQQAFNQGGYGVAGKFSSNTGVSAAKAKGNFKGVGYKGEAKEAPAETKNYGQVTGDPSKDKSESTVSASVTDKIKKEQLAKTKFTPANFQDPLSGQFDQYKKVDPETYADLKFKQTDKDGPLGYMGEPVYLKFETLSRDNQNLAKKYGIESFVTQTLKGRQDEVKLEKILKGIQDSKALEKLNFEKDFNKRIENLPDVIRGIIKTKEYYTEALKGYYTPEILSKNPTANIDDIFERPAFTVNWISNLTDSKNNGEITPEGYLIAKFFAQSVLPLKYNPKAIDPAKDEFNWCSAFVDHILSLTGNPRIKADVDPVTGKVTNTGSAANAYKNYGTQVKGGLEKANSGDIVVFNFDEQPDADHTSFLIGKEDYELFGIKPAAGMVYVLGGNQSNKVQIKAYNKSTILDIRRINRITKKEVNQLKEDNPQYKGFVEFIKEKDVPSLRPMSRPTKTPQDYVVRSGDNLGKIAKQFNTTVERLQELNGIENPNEIYVDQNIKLFNQGGLTMEQQMSLFQEGGMKDDGMDVDPVSGNDVPPGSLAKEVRDDIPAQLSEGEYVVPADVVQYYGVKFFEDLRMEAKRGLAEMDATGRIGGEPMSMTMIAIGEAGEEQKERQKKALGGIVGFTNGGGVSKDMAEIQKYGTFDPNKYRYVGATLGPSGQSMGITTGDTHSKMFYHPDGRVQAVPGKMVTVNGKQKFLPNTQYAEFTESPWSDTPPSQAKPQEDQAPKEDREDKNRSSFDAEAQRLQNENSLKISADRLELDPKVFAGLGLFTRFKLFGEEIKAMKGQEIDKDKINSIVNEDGQGSPFDLKSMLKTVTKLGFLATGNVMIPIAAKVIGGIFIDDDEVKKKPAKATTTNKKENINQGKSDKVDEGWSSDADEFNLSGKPPPKYSSDAGIQKGQEASASRYTGLAKKAAETQEKGIPDASGNIVPFNKGGLINKPKRTPKKPRGKGLGNKK